MSEGGRTTEAQEEAYETRKLFDRGPRLRLQSDFLDIMSYSF